MKNKAMTRLLAIASLALASSFSAHAATVIFSDMSSGNGAPALFDPAGSVAVGNDLAIGLDGFVASASAGGSPAAIVDSFTVTVTAPTGFYLSTIDYFEVYSYDASNGVTAITLSVIADGKPSLPASAAFANASGADVLIGIPTIVLGPGVEALTLSISNSLFAFGIGADAIIGKSLAGLSVGVTPIPLPPAIGLLGAALIGLATVSSRRNRAAA